MAINISPSEFGELLDPFNGLQDLQDKCLRTPTDPKITFSDDPLRMMRAIRFASQLNFEIAEETYQAIEPMHQRIEIVSKERIADELNKIILSDKPSIGFKILFDTRLLHVIFPEMVKLQGVNKVGR